MEHLSDLKLHLCDNFLGNNLENLQNLGQGLAAITNLKTLYLNIEEN